MNRNKWYKGPRAGEVLDYGKISVDGRQGAVWCKMNLRRWEGSFEAATWRWQINSGFTVSETQRGLLVLQLFSHVQLFATPWTASHQASLSCTISQNLFKFMSIESMKPSNHLILCHPLFSSPQYFPAPGSFPMSWLFASGGQSIGISASVSVLAMNIQGWFHLGLTGLISLLPKELSRVFSSTTVWNHQFLGTQSSLWSNSHIRTWLMEKQ